MTDFFVKLFNMSVAASWIVLAVVLLRPLLKKAPKWINCLLWAIVALRLVIPVTLESVFSLIPSAEVIPSNAISTQVPSIQSGIPVINGAVNPALLAQPGLDIESILLVAATVWAAGAVAMLVYSVITYGKLRRQVAASILQEKNIYICDDVQSPFILGMLRPKIYISSEMEAGRVCACPRKCPYQTPGSLVEAAGLFAADSLLV